MFEEQIGDDKSSYIKIKEIEQSEDGTRFAAVYFDDGKFKLRTFGSQTRS